MDIQLYKIYALGISHSEFKLLKTYAGVFIPKV